VSPQFLSGVHCRGKGFESPRAHQMKLVRAKNERMNRSATASLYSATSKKNVPCFSDMAVMKFFFGVLPSRSRVGGETMRMKFWQNYFLGKGFAKTSAHSFLNSDFTSGEGGVWGGIFHLLLFLFWRNSGRTCMHYTALLQKNASFPIIYLCHQVKNLGKT